jgi:hypothetical protein
MVDALSRAHRYLRPDGRLIDLRPATELVARVSVGDAKTGWSEAGLLTIDHARRQRYAAADLALQIALDRRWFAQELETSVEFARYADSADELRDYIAGKWRETHLGPETHARAVELFRAQPGGRVRLTERVDMRALTLGG